MIIGIDSMVLVYAELVPSTKGPKCHDYATLRKRARLLFINAIDNKDSIVLPTVAISEVLVPVPDNKRGSLILALQKRFICPPLDIKSASIAADVWARFRELTRDGDFGHRIVVRADALIVASAFAANATVFYSHDSQCRKMAELAGMEPRDLPTGKTLKEQFILQDIDAGKADEL